MNLPILRYLLKIIRFFHSSILHINSKQEKRRIKNEILKISKFPRYTKGTTNILRKRLLYADSASFLFMYKEIFEKEIYKFITQTNEPFIIDCGANIGLSVLYFKQLYPNSKITAFEPDYGIFEILKENCTNFNLTTIELINKAIWTSETSLDFFSEGADGGRIALITDKTQIHQIRTVRLKNYLKNNLIDFLKIDIEGAEANVIIDCENELTNVKYIFIEFHSFINQEQKLDTLLSILKKSGFRLHINSPGLTSNQPLIKINHYLNMDMQLNIYGFRT